MQMFWGLSLSTAINIGIKTDPISKLQAFASYLDTKSQCRLQKSKPLY